TSSARDSSRQDRKAPGNVSLSHLAAPLGQCKRSLPLTPQGTARRLTHRHGARPNGLVELAGDALDALGRRMEGADHRVRGGLGALGGDLACRAELRDLFL